MATYEAIQEYVKRKYNVSIKSCWIAHMKEVCGLDVKMSPKRYDENKRTNPCPDSKKYMIEDAFRHFGMVG